MRVWRGIVSAMLLAGVAIWAEESAAKEVDLRTVPDALPYAAEELAGVPHRETRSRYMGPALVLYDVDGDGIDDAISSQARYLTATGIHSGYPVTFFQKNLPPAFSTGPAERATCALLICRGLTAPQSEDLVAWATVPDGTRWRFWVMDPTTAETRAEFDLPGGRDVRADGVWDGNYFAVGPAEVQRDGQTVRALVIGCNVGYDKYGRALLAVDPTDGAILWRYDMGPNPFPHNVRLVDLMGDRRPEIVAIGRSPDNLAGEEINGTSDDLTRLFVLDAQGKLCWDRVLGEAFGNAELDIGDLTGNGKPELVTVVRATPSLRTALSVWTDAGLELARLEGEGQWMGVRIVARNDRKHPSLLVTDTSRLIEFDFENRKLTERRRVLFASNAAVNLVGDLLPDRGQEVVVSILREGRFVLDQNLAPLLFTPGNHDWVSAAVEWRTDDGSTVLTWPGTDQPALRITGAPLTWVRWQPWALGTSLAAFLVVLVVAVRRLIPESPTARREARSYLLERLELSSHGAIAPLKTVRRLTWHLGALQSAEAANEQLGVRMRETLTECRTGALPALAGIVDGALTAGVSSEIILEARESIADLMTLVEDLSERDFAPPALARATNRLAEAGNRAEKALLRMRAEVAAGFRADVAEGIRRTLRANELGLKAMGIEVTAARAAQAVAGGIGHETAPAPPLHVLCEAQELDYVLDNLVANAIEAMAASTRRHLTIGWYEADGMGVIDVSDTGRGLGPEEGERALTTHYTSKKEGGAGLPNSRKYLRKFGGALTIAAAEPGRGATFRVTLPRA